MSDEPKPAVPLRVRLPYATVDEFIARYGSNVARGGVFVASKSVKAEGTRLQFEFVLADGTPLLRGEGVVLRTQSGDEGEGRRPGMTVRFTRLDAESKALVDRVVAFRSGEPTPEPPEPIAVPPPSPTSSSMVLGLELREREVRVSAMTSVQATNANANANANADATNDAQEFAVVSRTGDEPLELLLQRAVEAARSSPGVGDVQRAVIAAPASMTDHPRLELLRAAERAGLEVLRLVGEPSAVALAYGHGRGLARKRVLTLSLDTEGVEAAVVGITGDDVEVLSTGAERFDKGEWLEHTVSRARTVLSSAGVTPETIDALLLVGPEARSHDVRRRIEAALGRPAVPPEDFEPVGAVARGAAILGDSLLRAEAGKRGATVSEILGVPIGIALRGGGMRRVLERGTRLPAEKTLTLPVQAGVALGVAVFQGDSERAEENAYLGSLQLQPERSGEAQLVFRLSVHGTVEVAAQVSGDRRERTLATEDASEEVRAALFAAAPLPDSPEPPPTTSGGVFGGLRRLFGKR